MSDVREPDAYDKAVAWLTENPLEIEDAWCIGNEHPAWILFGYCTPSRYSETHSCGCLTMVRGVSWRLAFEDDELTEAIKADERLPRSPGNITPEHLPVFAEWQRRMDKLWNRPAPVWSEPQAKGTS